MSKPFNFDVPDQQSTNELIIMYIDVREEALKRFVTVTREMVKDESSKDQDIFTEAAKAAIDHAIGASINIATEHAQLFKTEMATMKEGLADAYFEEVSSHDAAGSDSKES